MQLTNKELSHIGYFEGIGGFTLAAHWAGFTTVAYSETDSFCNRVLKYYLPHVPNLGDINNPIRLKKYANNLTLLTGGFPCQGFSVAGLRKGITDNRYLWPQMLSEIKFYNPDWVIAENVTGLLSMEDQSGNATEVFAQVESRKITRFPEADYYEAIYTRQSKLLINSICEDLENAGYEVQTLVIPAAAIQAPHQRERVWIVANATNTRIEGLQQERQNKFHRLGSTANTNGKRRLQSKFSRSSKFTYPNVKKGELLPTPTSSMVTYQDLIQAKYHSSNRPVYSDIMPTPTAQDGKNSTLSKSQINRDTVPGHLLKHGITGHLNPRYVSEMMGFPVDWLTLPFQNGETKA